MMKKPVLKTTAALATGGLILILATAMGNPFYFKNPQIQNKMKVEIWSDVACPFCYIGKRKFEAALNQFTHAEKVEVIWRSYLLNPTLVTDPEMSYYQSLANAKGWTTEYARQAGQNVTRMAATAGLQYNLEQAIPANTIRAHRLLQVAKAVGLGSAMKEELLKAHFIEGLNVDDPEVLQRLGLAAGLTTEQIKDGLNNPAYQDALLADLKSAEVVGVTGVPFFVFNGRTAVSGAQESGVFLRELERAYETFVQPSAK